jgi:RES domain-containing protein
LDLLDAIDALQRETFSDITWRVVREGRDPLQGAKSPSRWCDNQFDVLYMALEREGALAEIHALLSMQPVFPSKCQSFVHRVRVHADQMLRLDMESLAQLGVATEAYRERHYRKTQAIADAAYFLGFEGLLVPSARWPCSNAVFFTDRIAPDALSLEGNEADAIDWAAWRRDQRRTAE